MRNTASNLSLPFLGGSTITDGGNAFFAIAYFLRIANDFDMLRHLHPYLDSLRKIDLAHLNKKNRIHQGWYNDNLRWCSRGEYGGGINYEFEIDWLGENFLWLRYWIIDHATNSEQIMDYQVPLISVPCRFGGKKWFVLCPRCKRRCRILYENEGWFVCRKCTGLWYESQSYTPPFIKHMMAGHTASDIYESLKRKTYRGKPTRKYRKYLKYSHSSPINVV